METNEWQARPKLAAGIRLFLLLAPVITAFALAFFISRVAPPWRLGINPILWWVAVFCVANTYLLLADRFLSRYLPIAALYRLSLVFPDQAPSRFKSALRSTNSRRNLKRLEKAGKAGKWNDEIKHTEILLGLVLKLSEHDRMTRGHSERVQAYCDLVAEEMDIPVDDRAKLRWGAMLHDMGKLTVPAEILNKDSRPTDAEWAILQTHPAAGNKFVEPLRPWLGDWLGAVDQHHCRWDGKGYPYGLKGTEITLAGRIAAVADAYDVMTSIRSYKDALPAEVARRELARGSGSQFDPEVVRAFLQIGIGRLRLVAGPLAWLAGATGSVPSPVIGPVIAGTTAIVAAVGGIMAGYEPQTPPPDLAFVEEEAVEVVEDLVLLAIDDVSRATAETTALVDVLDNDRHPNGDELTLLSVTQPSAGEASIEDNHIRFDSPDQPGDYTMTYSVVDEAGNVDTAILVFTVHPRPVVSTTTTVTAATLPTTTLSTSTPSTTKPTTMPSTTKPSTTAGPVTSSTTVASTTATTATVTTVATTGATTSSTTVAANQAPVAVADYIATAEDTPVILWVMADDSDPDGDLLSITSVSGPSNGTAAISADGTTITYTPSAEFSGRDQFIYTIIDGNGGSAAAMATIDVTAVNDPPIVAPLATTVSEAATPGTVIGTVSVTDIDGSAPAFTLVAGRSLAAPLLFGNRLSDNLLFSNRLFGSLATDPLAVFAVNSSSGVITITGSLDFETAPVYSLTISVFDGANTVNAIVSVSVIDVNEAPSGASSSLTVTEGAAVTSADLTALHFDPEGDGLTISLVSNPGANSVATTTDGSTVTYSHDGSETTSDTIVYRVTDTAGNTSIGTINVTVTPVNDPPSVASASGSVAENLVSGQSVASVSAFDPEGGPLSFSIVAGDPGGEFAIDPVTGEVTTAAALDFEATPSYSLIITVSDGVNTVNETVTVTVVDTNEAPASASSSITVDEGASISTTDLTVLHIDPEGDVVTITSIPSPGANSSSTTTDGITIIYVHDDSETTSDVIGYLVTDSVGNTASGTITVTINAINDPPATLPLSGSVAENLAAGEVIGTVPASDPEGVSLVFSIVAGDPLGEFVIDPGSGSVTTAAPLDFETTPSYSLTVAVSDAVNTVNETVTVTVIDGNEPPAPASSSLTVDEGAAITSADLTLLHTDPEGDVVTITTVTAPGANTTSTATDGSTITYSHDGSETTADTIAYVVTDTAGNTATGTITVTINPVNDPPIIAPIADQTAYVNVPFSVSTTISDPDGSIVLANVAVLPGDITTDYNPLTGVLTISGTPSAAILDTTWPLTVTAVDNDGTSANITFDLVVDPVGRSPFAGLIVISEVLYAESDPYNPAFPFAAYLMDEYIEFTNAATFGINLENFYLSDTEDPGTGTDFQFHTGVPPYLPQHTGRLHQAFTQSTPLVAGQVVTAPVRRPVWTSYQLQDGSPRPATAFSNWFRGVDYGFPAGPNSNWEALKNAGDDLWFWDPQGLLVAFVAWDDGTGDAHIVSRPPAALGIWDPADEARLAGAANGQSISLAAGTDNSTSACWELSASGDTVAAGCTGATATSDVDPPGFAPPLVLQGRISSQGVAN